MGKNVFLFYMQKCVVYAQTQTQKTQTQRQNGSVCKKKKENWMHKATNSNFVK